MVTRAGVAWLCGQESAAYLRQMVAGQPLTCAERDRDRYRRVVATCTLPDGRDVGAEMVAAGYALAYRRYAGGLYDGPESEARASRRGLWAGGFVAPWEWRRSER